MRYETEKAFIVSDIVVADADADDADDDALVAVIPV